MKIRDTAFIPLSLGLMFFPSLTFRVALDGAESTYYGFPLPWNSRSPAISLAKDIYWLPLAIDIVFYGIVGFLLWRYVARYVLNWPTALKLSTLVLVWAYGAFAVWIMSGMALIDPHYHIWFQDKFEIFHVGLGFNV